MKKKKLTLSRETLAHLGTLGMVVGGITAGPCSRVGDCDGPPGDGGTGSAWCNSAGICSGGCATGGACTVSCP
jgi:hypothetical protein